MRLFRAIGLGELEALAQTHFKAFPSRTEAYPTFQPIVDREFARQLAADWNAQQQESGFVGFVTQFDVQNSFMAQFAVQTSGPTCHREIWVPAEQVDSFNRHLESPIRVIEAFPGVRFSGRIDPATQLPLELARSLDAQP